MRKQHIVHFVIFDDQPEIIATTSVGIMAEDGDDAEEQARKFMKRYAKMDWELAKIERRDSNE
jgi:hypothetical protein